MTQMRCWTGPRTFRELQAAAGEALGAEPLEVDWIRELRAAGALLSLEKLNWPGCYRPGPGRSWEELDQALSGAGTAVRLRAPPDWVRGGQRESRLFALYVCHALGLRAGQALEDWAP